MTSSLLRVPLLTCLGLGPLFAAELGAQEVRGTWQGGLRIAGEYSPFTLRFTDAGGLRGSLDVPSRDVLDQPLTVRLAEASLRLDMDHPGVGQGRFEGRLEDGLFIGTFTLSQPGGRRQGRFEAVRVVDMDRRQLRRFEGVYDVPGFGRLKVFVLDEPTRLSLQAFALQVGNQVPLFPVSETECIAGLTVGTGPAVMARLFFAPSAAGGPPELRFQRPGGEPVDCRIVDTGLALDRERLAAYFERARRTRDVPGFSIGVVQGDELVYAQGFGVADLGTRRPATPATLYQVGSLSKAFAATLFGILEAEGRVSLAEPVRRLLPEDRSFPVLEGPRGSRITLERLLTHTSGLPRDPVNRPDTEDGVPAPYGVEDLYSGLPTTVLLFEPGEHFAYSNLGFGLLGHALARSAGQPFEALLRERVLAPLGMSDTSIDLSPEREARLATHYWVEESPRRPRPRWVFGEIAANGGVVSNVVDLAQFLSVQLRARSDRAGPIDAAILRRLHEPRVRRDGWDETIGLGWWIDRGTRTGPIVSHGGEIDGHSTHFAFSPRHRVGVIVLANLGGSTAYDLGTWLMEEAVDAARARGVPSASDASRWFLNGDWEDAAWAYGVIAAATPGNGMARYRHGVALYRTHRYPQAREALAAAVELGYAMASAHLGLARIHAASGDADRALEALRAAAGAGLDLRDVAGDRALNGLAEDPRFAELIGR